MKEDTKRRKVNQGNIISRRISADTWESEYEGHMYNENAMKAYINGETDILISKDGYVFYNGNKVPFPGLMALIDEWTKSDNEHIHEQREVQEPTKCICDMTDLMRYGCKCGGK